jgi:hypothetical protein
MWELTVTAFCESEVHAKYVAMLVEDAIAKGNAEHDETIIENPDGDD